MVVVCCFRVFRVLFVFCFVCGNCCFVLLFKLFLVGYCLICFHFVGLLVLLLFVFVVFADCCLRCFSLSLDGFRVVAVFFCFLVWFALFMMLGILDDLLLL